MNLEERQSEINKLIMNMANENAYITKEQIARARNLYLNDSRSLETISQELSQYSDDVKLTMGTQASIDNAFAEEEAKKNYVIPEVAKEMTPKEYEMYSTPRQEVKKELDSMFNQEPTPTNEFSQVETIKPVTDAKVFVKAPEQAAPLAKAGFSTLSSLLTIASLISIMGIVISALIIFTN